VFENRELRKMFAPKEDGVTDCRKFHNEELHNLSSSNIIRMNKSRKMRWVQDSAHTRKMINEYKRFVRNP
jgi:hypothetical protein